MSKSKVSLDVSFSYFLLPLKNRLMLSKATISAREGLLIKVSDESGTSGYGECAPLPGFHPEELEDCMHFLEEHAPDLVKLNILPQNLDFNLPFLGLLDDDDDDSDNDSDDDDDSSFPGTLMFAFEQALLSWVIQKDRSLVKKFFPTNVMASVQIQEAAEISFPYNFLLTNSDKTVSLQSMEVWRLRREKYKTTWGQYIPPTIKIKIGGRPIEEEIALLKGMLPIKAADEDTRIIFDVNCNFSPKQLMYFLSELKKFFPLTRIAYIEDPFENAEKFKEYNGHSSYPTFALDELLLEYLDDSGGINTKSLPQNISTLILKPTMIGISGCCKIMDDINKYKLPLKAVLSSTFDSGLTIKTIAQLSQFAGVHYGPHGIDTYKYLANDIIFSDFDYTDGIFTISNQDLFSNSKIRTNLLQNWSIIAT